MSERIIDGVSIPSGGGTETATFGLDADRDYAILEVGGDSNSTDLTVDVTGAAAILSGSSVSTNISDSVSNFDASGDYVVQLGGLDGVELVEITVTNNAASSTTITVTDHTN